MKAYGNVEIYPAKPCCAVCGGGCCKRMACHYSPRDFEDLSFESLKKEIKKGRISIDWWEADSPEYYLRARHIDGDIVDPSWGGTCINLTENGCSLSFEERPLGGKAVKPDPLRGCTSSYTKGDCKEEWKPYSETLKRLVEYFLKYREEENDEVAQRLGREYIGIEINKEYEPLIRKRLENHKEDKNEQMP